MADSTISAIMSTATVKGSATLAIGSLRMVTRSPCLSTFGHFTSSSPNALVNVFGLMW